MKTLKELGKLTYVVEHSPNCRSPFLVRLNGASATIDKLQYSFTKNRTNDILGFGKTLVQAAQSAMKQRRAFERQFVREVRARARADEEKGRAIRRELRLQMRLKATAA